MIRTLLVLLIMAAAIVARAQDCYYYWVHQCVEVIDASQRQLQQYVLISPAVNYLPAKDGQCQDAVAQQQEAVNAALLAAFNQEAEKIDACQTPITELPARAYTQPHKATWHYNRSRKPNPNKTVIPVGNLPVLQGP